LNLKPTRQKMEVVETNHHHGKRGDAALTGLGDDSGAGSKWPSDQGTIAVGEMIGIIALVMIAVVAAITVLEVAGYDVGGWLGGLLGTSS
jgi:hypothetical protein